MSEVKVNKISPRSGTTVTLGDSGDTITLASGVSLTGVNATFSGDLTVDTDTLYVDSTNNRVGVGTSSPNAELHIADSSANAVLRLESSDTGSGNINFDDQSAINRGRIIYDHSDNSMRLTTNASEAMRIDSSGNVLVGKTSSNIGTTGVELQSDRIYSTRDGDVALYLNRLSSNGPILEISKDGGLVGKIGTRNSDLTIFSTDTNHTGFRFAGNCVFPTGNNGVESSNTMDFGTASVRFRNSYLSGGIYLGGSADALDDYETGTWTPSTDHGTVTSSYAKYTKIGNRVLLSATINSVSDTSNSNPFLIRGLPFTNSGEVSNGIMGRFFSASNSGDAVTIYIENNTTHIQFWVTANNSINDRLSHSELTSTSANFYINIHYTTSS